MNTCPAPDNPAPSVGQRRLAAIAFVDIAGYSVLMAEDETATHARWMSLLNGVLRPQAALHRGKIVKSTGDGVLAEFPSALDAVEWARGVQRAVPQFGMPDEGAPAITLRVAVHIGDVMTTADDIYGDGVNVTARLQEFAEPGGIVISEAVHDLVRGSVGRQAVDIGLLQLKNFERPVRAFSLPAASQPATTPARSEQSAVPSIAVLPLLNVSGNADDIYFADGIIEDIIVSLAGLRELLVIARASTLFYGRAQPADPREVGRALGVRYVMTGSVRRSAGEVRISVQLCDANTGASLWAHATAVPLGELFAVQDDIVTRIVAGIAPHVRRSELRHALRKRPGSFTAYDYTLRALDLITSLDRDDFMQAREFLDKAIAVDRRFGMPVAWAARWHSLCIGQGWSQDRREDATKAAELAHKAIGLDRQNALALATYAHVRSFLFHDYDTALEYFDRAIAVGPSNSLAWILSGATLSYVGRGEEAVRHAEHGLRLSPFDPGLFYYYDVLGMAHYSIDNYSEAVKWLRMSVSENPAYTATPRLLAAALAALDRTEEASAAAADLMRLDPGFSVSRYERDLQPFRHPEIKARFLHDLRKAGLPR
jgi:TolB-like protein/tetratricopeptide (TPR) repeat protein